MIHIFTDIADKIQNDVPEIAWIDIDEGQFELFDDPPVDYPCVLIDMPAGVFEDLPSLKQTGDLTITVKVAFSVFENINSEVPSLVKDEALAHFDILQKVMKAIHGMESEHYGTITRKSFQKDKVKYPKIYNVIFACSIFDSSLESDLLEEQVITNDFYIPKP